MLMVITWLILPVGVCLSHTRTEPCVSMDTFHYETALIYKKCMRCNFHGVYILRILAFSDFAF